MHTSPYYLFPLDNKASTKEDWAAITNMAKWKDALVSYLLLSNKLR